MLRADLKYDKLKGCVWCFLKFFCRFKKRQCACDKKGKKFVFWCSNWLFLTVSPVYWDLKKVQHTWKLPRKFLEFWFERREWILVISVGAEITVCLPSENLWFGPGKVNCLPWRTPGKLLEFCYHHSVSFMDEGIDK